MMVPRKHTRVQTGHGDIYEGHTQELGMVVSRRDTLARTGHGGA